MEVDELTRKYMEEERMRGTKNRTTPRDIQTVPDIQPYVEPKKEVKKEIKKEATLVNVPSGYTNAIQLEDGETLVDERGLLLLIYNKLLKIERNVA